MPAKYIYFERVLNDEWSIIVSIVQPRCTFLQYFQCLEPSVDTSVVKRYFLWVGHIL